MKLALVIAIGNEFRGDDSVGLVVADALEAGRSGIRVVRHAEAGLALIDAWEGERAVIVVDAMWSGAPSGTIQCWDACEDLPPGRFSGSTHGIGLSEAIAMARMLSRLPPRLLVFGIEGRTFQIGEPVSPEVMRAAQQLARALPNLCQNCPRLPRRSLGRRGVTGKAVPDTRLPQ